MVVAGPLTAGAVRGADTVVGKGAAGRSLDVSGGFKDCLARHHRLRRVLAEGMTEKDVPLYLARIAELRKAGEQLPALHRQLAEVRQLLASMSAGGRAKTDRYDKALAVERDILGLLHERRLDVLRFGAAGRLLAAGEIEAVLPLDEASCSTPPGQSPQAGR